MTQADKDAIDAARPKPFYAALKLESATKWDYHLTDIGNAELFAANLGEHLRFIHPKKQWLTFRDHRWTPDSGQYATRLGMELIRDASLVAALSLRDADDNIRKRVLRHYLRSESQRAVLAMLNLAKNLPPIADDGMEWDKNPNLIGCRNGVIEFSDDGSFTFRDGQPEDRITKSVAVNYVPDAKCPTWETFRAQVHPDEATRDWTGLALGLSITGHTREQVTLWAHGGGSNGKTTELETVATILGDYAWSLPFATLFGRQSGSVPNDIAALQGRRFIHCSEVPVNAHVNEQRLKSLTGGDTLTARFLYGEYFELKPEGKFWFAVNTKPASKDESEGYWRRIRLIPYTQRFDHKTEPRRDDNLRDKLLAESEGIFAWLVRQASVWYQTGLGEVPAAVVHATSEYRDENDPLRAFIESSCVLVNGASIGARGFYDAFVEWCKENAEIDTDAIPTQTAVGRRMKQWPDVHVEKKRSHNIYYGIGLAENDYQVNVFDLEEAVA